MSDEVVICKGKVVSVTAYSQYNASDNSFSYELENVHSGLVLDPAVFSTDVDITNQVTSSGAVYTPPKFLNVRGKLEFGEEYEFIMRPVKKPGAVAAQSGGPRKFKEEDE